MSVNPDSYSSTLKFKVEYPVWKTSEDEKMMFKDTVHVIYCIIAGLPSNEMPPSLIPLLV